MFRTPFNFDSHYRTEKSRMKPKGSQLPESALEKLVPNKNLRYPSQKSWVWIPRSWIQKWNYGTEINRFLKNPKHRIKPHKFCPKFNKTSSTLIQYKILLRKTNIKSKSINTLEMEHELRQKNTTKRLRKWHLRLLLDYYTDTVIRRKRTGRSSSLR